VLSEEVYQVEGWSFKSSDVEKGTTIRKKREALPSDSFNEEKRGKKKKTFAEGKKKKKTPLPRIISPVPEKSTA